MLQPSMKRWVLLLLGMMVPVCGTVRLGVEELFSRGYDKYLKDKRVGLITNQTGVNSHLTSTIDLCSQRLDVVALFAPEHGLRGSAYAAEKVADGAHGEIPVYSLYGETRRPTPEMLKGVDVLIFDIQDVGTRCYTFASTLFYVMEAAAPKGIEVVVLDRPNPINGTTVDGPMLHEKWRSFVGYVNVPLCHGMTMGELARFFNGEYGIGCRLTVVPMRGWRRHMTWRDTGLSWVPTSPHIPEADTAAYYPATGMIGEVLSNVSVGVGYTLPFKVVGAPWIDGQRLAQQLEAQKLPGVVFQSFSFTPFFGRFAKTECFGVRLVITDVGKFRPVTTQFMILGVLKTLYPERWAERATLEGWRRDLFCKLSGSEEMLRIVNEEPYIAWKLIGLDQEQRQHFLRAREQYLLYR